MANEDAKTLAKGLIILEQLAQSANGMTASQLASAIGIHKTSIYRHLKMLSRGSYVNNGADGRYHLGNKILELASQLLRRMPLRETGHPFLVKLSAETHKTVHLCVLDGHEVVYIDKVETQRSLPILSRIGSRAPTYCTGVGKALLSGLSTDEVVSLLEVSLLTRRTASTITDPLKLLEEVRSISERGYAVDDGENEEGIKCYATLIRAFGGDVVGAISATGLKREFDDPEEAEKLLVAVLKTAAEISRALGHVDRST